MRTAAFLIAGFLVPSVSLGVVAVAARAAAPDRRVLEAADLFREGRYHEAADLFARLRDEKDQPVLSCNVGLSLAKGGDHAHAVEPIRYCLASAGGAVGASDRGDYEKLLAWLKARAAGEGGDVGAASMPAASLVAIEDASEPAPPRHPDAGAVDAPPVPLPGVGVIPPPVVVPLPLVPSASALSRDGGDAGFANASVRDAGVRPAPVVALPPVAAPAVVVPQVAPMPPLAAGAAASVPAPAPARAAAAEVQQKPAPQGKAMAPVGSYVTGVLGLVSTAAGVALFLHANAVAEELDASAMRTLDRSSLEDERSHAKSAATYAFIGGGVSLVASVVWAIVAPAHANVAQAAKKLDVAISPHGVGIAGAF